MAKIYNLLYVTLQYDTCDRLYCHHVGRGLRSPAKNWDLGGNRSRSCFYRLRSPDKCGPPLAGGCGPLRFKEPHSYRMIYNYHN